MIRMPPFKAVWKGIMQYDFFTNKYDPVIYDLQALMEGMILYEQENETISFDCICVDMARMDFVISDQPPAGQCVINEQYRIQPMDGLLGE